MESKRRKVLELPNDFGKHTHEVKRGHWAANLPKQPKTHEEKNKTEQKFADLLDQEKAEGLWRHVMFNSVRLKIGRGAWYKPDFMAICNDGSDEGEITFFEVKGFWTAAARVRIKSAAHQFPMFKFIGVRLVKGTFEREYF